MRYRIGDRVTVPDETTIEAGDLTVRIPAGMRLEVLDVRDGAVKVLDLESLEGVWIPDRFVTRATP